jgi:hypothetical protein
LCGGYGFRLHKWADRELEALELGVDGHSDEVFAIILLRLQSDRMSWYLHGQIVW